MTGSDSKCEKVCQRRLAGRIADCVLVVGIFLSSGARMPAEERLQITEPSASENLVPLEPGQERKPAADLNGTDSSLVTADTNEVRLIYFLDQLLPRFGLTLEAIPPEARNASVTFRFDVDDFGWETVLNVVFDPLDLEYTEHNGRIRVMWEKDYQALPPVKRVYDITHPDSDKAMRYAIQQVGRLARIEYIDFKPDFEKLNVTVTAQPKDHRAVHGTIQTVNKCWLIPIFPDLHWPRTIPTDIPAVKFSQSDMEKRAEGLVLSTFFLEHVAATKMAQQLQPHIGSREKAEISVFPTANAIVVVTTPTNMVRIASICKYLDSKRWYSSQESVAEED